MTGVSFRRGTDLALLVDAAVAALTVGLDLNSPVRVITVLIAVCLLPGAAVLTAAPVTDRLAWLGLASVISLAAGTMLGCAMLVVHWWHPGAFGAVGLVCAAVLAADLVRDRRSEKASNLPASQAGADIPAGRAKADGQAGSGGAS
ncbi:MAG: hypothetical protein ACQSGP_14835 [Frankia sp.]